MWRTHLFSFLYELKRRNSPAQWYLFRNCQVGKGKNCVDKSEQLMMDHGVRWAKKGIHFSTVMWRKKKCLIGVEENWRSEGTHENIVPFFFPKCFHSLNKFNKTSFDWQESDLPQCLLFALTFLVSSCAPFWMRWRLEICIARTHIHTCTHTINLEQVRLLCESLQVWMCYLRHISEVLLHLWEFYVFSCCTVGTTLISQESLLDDVLGSITHQIF